MTEALLDINGLCVEFITDEGTPRAVDHVSFSVKPNEVLGVVGESGCGKSVTAMSLLSLIPSPPGRVSAGKAMFQGRDLIAMPHESLRKIRGKEISMIFQEPGACLSPLHRIGDQLAEAVMLHYPMPKQEALDKGRDWLSKVGIPEPDRMLKAYPFQLSGGMQQRVMIAMAMINGPSLIIADEPTTALDVTIAAQIFDLMRQMRDEKTSVMLISHDLGVIWEMCDRVLVMYAGKIVEEAEIRELFENPLHPYTRALMRSVPVLDEDQEELATIKGQVPSPLNYPPGCRFHDRCPHAAEQCKKESPELRTLAPNKKAACFFAEKWMK
ncbi:oligopeptide/dipeptide ABC transporter, ATPase subunit [Desulfatibacillum aliphaticivorans]|uniref:Oligopeptide/dipeptide ABC transporter, ATPase subunit n=1 Tax=Desulfatibacillum aliphaticivorans TaxID=218208 RepID=B8FIA1_DESAL|nr:ABC transporter ATP-binding protein [Desulfatibacillum aliphaticivorans]ACL02668.1 oligopeptide/dipeptide ABC transporter, ATPase subunit [Desulfatibacillum aliphaticivorans]